LPHKHDKKLFNISVETRFLELGCTVKDSTSFKNEDADTSYKIFRVFGLKRTVFGLKSISTLLTFVML